MNNETVIKAIREKLDGMINKSFEYAGNIHRFKKYEIDTIRDRVHISTDRSDYDRTFDSFFDFIKFFKESAPDVDVVETNHDIIKRQINNSVIQSLKDVLLQNIEKIKADKSYIPQAEAIKGNVDSIINLAKTEISYMTFFKKNK